MTMRHIRKAHEKYWNFLQLLDEKRETSGTERIEISYSDFSNHPKINDRRTGVALLERLEREKGITILEKPELDYLNTFGDNWFKVEILPSFENIFKKEGEKYQKLASEYQRSVQKNKPKNITPIELPEDTVWEDITIQFTNMYDVQILHKDKLIKSSNNVELGCYKINNDNKEGDKQWLFLTHLSLTNGNLPLDNYENENDKDNAKQYKTKLTKRLKKYFGIDEDPFHDTKEQASFHTRFKLIPSLENTSKETYGIEDEVKEFFDEQTQSSNNTKNTNPPKF